ncbi:hypothetical protein X737_29020 [Mesorhizobium sp. L48C026A00]|nr:hypothetical protein X737_29020 [Mesorhizobium sp. L48C026A00]
MEPLSMKRPTDPTTERTGRLNFQVTPDIRRRFKLKAIAADMSQSALFEFIFEQATLIDALIKNLQKLS